MTTENKKHKNRGSLMYRTWLYFIGMTIVVLAFLWTTEVIFFKAYYQEMKEHEISKSCAAVVDQFTGVVDEEFVRSIEGTINSNSLIFAVFTINEGIPVSEADKEDINILLYRDPVSWQFEENSFSGPNESGADFRPEKDYFMLAGESGDKPFTYRVRKDKNDSYNFVMGAKKMTTSGVVYFYASYLMVPMDITISLLANQLVLVTCICVIVSVMLSYALSKNITQPITEFAATAALLGKGGKVKFASTGYNEFDELAKALNHSAEELEKTEKLRRDFLANVSHDLRTPLTMVKAYAEMIRDISGSDAKKRSEHCRVIIDEVDRLTLLVNDLLDLSKLQAGTREPDFKIVNLSETVKHVMERFSILSARDGYNFVLDVDENCFVYCDERMLEQIFYNLIGNAVSYTGADKKVTVRVKRSGEKVRAEIGDTGRGIAPSERDKIWDRYYRSSQSKRAVVGSGIGLSIVKNLLILHNAEFGIDSVVNNGSTFWFMLPYKNETSDASVADAAEEKQSRKKSKS